MVTHLTMSDVPETFGRGVGYLLSLLEKTGYLEIQNGKRGDVRVKEFPNWGWSVSRSAKRQGSVDSVDDLDFPQDDKVS